MFVDQFNALKERVDALRAGRPPPLGWFERARSFFVNTAARADLEQLRALDGDLERAGIHTAADARLLRELGTTKGVVSTLGGALLDRAQLVLQEFDASLIELERLAHRESLTPAAREALLNDFTRLSRVVKVAAVFSGAPASPEIYARPPARARGVPELARLAIAEFLSDRAQREVADTAKKRRDLDLAYELVLRMGSETKTDRERSRNLRLQLSAARERVRAAPAVRSFDELVRHVRHVARVSPHTAWRSLRALYERAVEAGDANLAEVANAAALSVADPRQLPTAVERAQELRSVGWRAAPYEASDGLEAGGKQGVDDELAAKMASFAFALSDDQRRALELAAGCARFFDVEDALAEEIVEAETVTTRPKQKRVPYPTQLMSYETTNSLDDFQHFVLDRPGALVLELASGRQLVRSYLEEEVPPKPKQARQGAVRVYVLDASGSMHGSRARFRDALLIAELNAIRVKALAKLPFDPLYLSFFNDAPTELVRVDSGDQAARQITRLFEESPAEGQTDISLALVSAFDSIGRARGVDPYLSRATVVLVTDGEDGVDLELIKKTRSPYEGLEIALSFISLGEENTDLRSLVLEQRDAGRRAFYSHLSDAEIQLARTEFDTAWRTLLPADVTVTGDVLEKLAPHLEALERIAAGHAVAAAEAPSHEFDALFPEAPTPGVPAPPQLARVTDIVEAVAETSGLAPADGRRGEAITLLLHLLQLYSIPMARYVDWVRTPDERLHKAVARLRAVC
ncbi:MAG: vWA domain-containing protein [Archangium sp.]